MGKPVIPVMGVLLNQLILRDVVVKSWWAYDMNRRQQMPQVHFNLQIRQNESSLQLRTTFPVQKKSFSSYLVVGCVHTALL